MRTLGHIRISTGKQDMRSQRHILLEYAHENKLTIDEFIEIEVSSRKNQGERRISELLGKLQKGDLLLVAELSRLGRNMLEVTKLILEFEEKGIRFKSVRQPELNTEGLNGKLITLLFGYIAETEREFISMRTKQGLAAAKASGKKLGRPKGSRNKKGRVLDAYREQINNYLSMRLPIASIMKIINDQLDRPLSYNTYNGYIAECGDSNVGEIG